MWQVHAHIFLTNQARRDGDHGPLFAQMVTDINTSTAPDPQASAPASVSPWTSRRHTLCLL